MSSNTQLHIWGTVEIAPARLSKTEYTARGGASVQKMRQLNMGASTALTRVKTLTTDSNATSNGMDPRVPLVAVRVLISDFNDAVVIG